VPARPDDEPGYRAVVDWASEVLSESASSEPERADTHYHLAVCQDYLDQPVDSLASAEAALTINPRYQKALALKNKLAAQQAPNDQRMAA